MSDINKEDDLEIEEIEEVEDVENTNDDNDEDDYEEICYLCRRPESKTGKMIELPNNIHICSECMQKTFDAMGKGGFGYDDIPGMSNIPNISMINLADLQNMVPKKQKIKKKK